MSNKKSVSTSSYYSNYKSKGKSSSSSDYEEKYEKKNILPYENNTTTDYYKTESGRGKMTTSQVQYKNGGHKTATQYEYKSNPVVTKSYSNTQYVSGANLRYSNSNASYGASGSIAGVSSHVQASGRGAKFHDSHGSLNLQSQGRSAEFYTTSHGNTLQAQGRSGEFYGSGFKAEDGEHTVGHLSGTIYPTRVTNEQNGARNVLGRSILRTFKDESRSHVIETNELVRESNVREHLNKSVVRVPKKVIREEVIERVFVVPETVTIEVFEDDEIEVDEHIIETQPRVQVEKIVEVPEIEEVEIVVEQEVINLKERIIEVEKIVPVEKIVVNKVEQHVERIVEEIQVQHVDSPYAKYKPREVKVQENIETMEVHARYEDVVVEKEKIVVKEVEARVVTPTPVEAITTVEFRLPQIVAKQNIKKYPVYLPRFIEVPVSRQFANKEFLASQEVGGICGNVSVSDKLKAMMAGSSISLCDIENFAKTQTNIMDHIKFSHDRNHVQSVLSSEWRNLINDRSKEEISKSMYTTITQKGHQVGSEFARSHVGVKARGGRRYSSSSSSSNNKRYTSHKNMKVHNYPSKVMSTNF